MFENESDNNFSSELHWALKILQKLCYSRKSNEHVSFYLKDIEYFRGIALSVVEIREAATQIQYS